MISRGAEILCLLGGLWKIGEVKRVDVKSGYRTKALITWARLARFKEISAPWLNATKISFAIIWQQSQSARPVSWDPSIVMPGSRDSK